MHCPLALADSVKTSWEFLTKGGVFMIPLGITAFVGVAAILFKFLSCQSMMPLNIMEICGSIAGPTGYGKVKLPVYRFSRITSIKELKR